LICSLDTLRQDRVFARLQEALEPYDLAIFDEAHKLSADRDADLTVRKTDRYRLAAEPARAGRSECRRRTCCFLPPLLIWERTSRITRCGGSSNRKSCPLLTRSVCFL